MPIIERIALLNSTMNVRSPKQWDTKHGVTRYFRFTVDMFFVLNFFISLMSVWLEKTTVLFNLYTQTSQIYCFRRVHKILRWIGSGDFKTFNFFLI